MGKKQSEPRTRVITGIVIAIIVCIVLLFSHLPIVIHCATALLCFCSVWELYHAIKGNTRDWTIALFLLIAAAVIGIPITSYSAAISMVFPFGILLSINLVFQVGKKEKLHTETLLCMTVLIVIFFRAIPEIRNLDKGFYLLTATILVGCITDIGAYTVGRKYGKRKLAPKISPNKTWEGAIGGTLTAFVVMMSISSICERLGVLSADEALLTSYILWASIAGQFGDLTMSSIKRISGVKDYANFLPGHGGLLDRFDSLMFIAPFTYLFCQYCGSFYF